MIGYTDGLVGAWGGWALLAQFGPGEWLAVIGIGVTVLGAAGGIVWTLSKMNTSIDVQCERIDEQNTQFVSRFDRLEGTIRSDRKDRSERDSRLFQHVAEIDKRLIRLETKAEQSYHPHHLPGGGGSGISRLPPPIPDEDIHS